MDPLVPLDPGGRLDSMEEVLALQTYDEGAESPACSASNVSCISIPSCLSRVSVVQPQTYEPSICDVCRER